VDRRAHGPVQQAGFFAADERALVEAALAAVRADAVDEARRMMPSWTPRAGH
jgi:predicted dithiol-disulfide oxidoreductase (DUF899 family)